jgi:hypothetical protein
MDRKIQVGLDRIKRIYEKVAGSGGLLNGFFLVARITFTGKGG